MTIESSGSRWSRSLPGFLFAGVHRSCSILYVNLYKSSPPRHNWRPNAGDDDARRQSCAHWHACRSESGYGRPGRIGENVIIGENAAGGGEWLIDCLTDWLMYHYSISRLPPPSPLLALTWRRWSTRISSLHFGTLGGCLSWGHCGSIIMRIRRVGGWKRG